MGDARFPPMVVQPLCDALVRPALASGEALCICIAASRAQDRARLYVAARPVQAGPARECLGSVRHTLLSMFGPLAQLEAKGPIAGVATISVEVPYDAAPRANS